MRTKASRVVGVILLGLRVGRFLPMAQVNSTLSDFIAFAVMLVGVWVAVDEGEGAAAKQGASEGRGAVGRYGLWGDRGPFDARAEAEK